MALRLEYKNPPDRNVIVFLILRLEVTVIYLCADVFEFLSIDGDVFA